MPNSNLQVVSRLLGATVEELDISPLQYELAVRRYSDLGQWLVALGIGDPDVYPQGSFRLGTVLRPTAGGDFDIDLVFLRFLAKESITQEELRSQAGQLLRDYIAARGASNGNPDTEGARPLLGIRLYGRPLPHGRAARHPRSRRRRHRRPAVRS